MSDNLSWAQQNRKMLLALGAAALAATTLLYVTKKTAKAITGDSTESMIETSRTNEDG